MAQGTGVVTLIPVYIPNACTLDRIACDVTTGAATAVVRLGIYNSDPATDLPSSRLLDAGTVDASTNGAKEITISQAVTAGLYYLAAVSQTASATLRIITAAMLPVLGTSFLATGAPLCGFLATGVTGGLPDPGPTGVTNNAYRVGVRTA